MKTVSIIILNFNGTKDTLECLESIQKLQVIGYKLQVIVVDNGSRPEDDRPLAEKLKIQSASWRINFQFIKNKENLGFSGGNNVGIRYALDKGADYVVILNNDTVLDKNLIIELLKVAESDKKIGIVVPKIYFAKGQEFHKDRYAASDKGKVIWYAGGIMDWPNVMGIHRGVDEVDHGQYERLEKTEFATGCCMIVKKEVIEKIGPPAGGFDEKYFLYYEDADFSMRVKHAGYTIMYAPKAVIWHLNAGSVGGSGSSLQDYYTTRNRMLFGLRFAPLRSKIALFRESIRLFVTGRKWQRVGIRDFYCSRFGKGSFAI